MKHYHKDDCVFCKMALGEIPVEKLWENDEFFCIKDKYPSAPIHLLVIPKQHIDKKTDTLEIVGDSQLWGKYLSAVLTITKEQGLFEKGYEVRLWGGGYQLLDHEHIHILSGHKVE